MPLKQYSREFILSKRCHTVNDISILANIDVTLDILTKKGLKVIKMAQSKKNVKGIPPNCKPLEKSNFSILKNAVHFYMNTEDANANGCTSNQIVGASSVIVPSNENQNIIPRSSLGKRIQYSRDFLLSRKCVPNSGQVFARVNISTFKCSPFTQAGIKKILWIKNTCKKKSEPFKLYLNSNLPNIGAQGVKVLDPNSPNFQPLSQIENYYSSFPVVPNFQTNTETACLPTSMSMDRENLSAGDLTISELEKKYESRLRTMKEKYEKEIRILKAQHFKEIQNMRLKVKEDFEKTLGVANSVILIDEHEVKTSQLKEQLEASLVQNKEADQLNTILKKELEDKDNELKLHKLLAEEEKEDIRKECEELMDVVATETGDKARKEFLQVLETELECPICSEMFIEASLLSSCSHVFCQHCITHWTRTRDPNLNCPLCRARFTQENIKAFPLGQNIMQKIEDKLPGEMQVRRRAVIAQRNANPLA